MAPSGSTAGRLLRLSYDSSLVSDAISENTAGRLQLLVVLLGSATHDGMYAVGDPVVLIHASGRTTIFSLPDLKRIGPSPRKAY